MKTNKLIFSKPLTGLINLNALKNLCHRQDLTQIFINLAIKEIN
jgi:hypothetical protein